MTPHAAFLTKVRIATEESSLTTDLPQRGRGLV